MAKWTLLIIIYLTTTTTLQKKKEKLVATMKNICNQCWCDCCCAEKEKNNNNNKRQIMPELMIKAKMPPIVIICWGHSAKASGAQTGCQNNSKWLTTSEHILHKTEKMLCVSLGETELFGTHTHTYTCCRLFYKLICVLVAVTPKGCRCAKKPPISAQDTDICRIKKQKNTKTKAT